MKLGEIKIEALKLMFVNYNIDFVINELPNIALDENYGSYLVNMPGAINRCFASIEEKGVLPVKTYILNADEGLASGSYIRFDLPKLIEDYFDVDRIVCETANGEYIGDHEYQKEGDTLVLKDFGVDDKYVLLYLPRIERISSLTPDDEEILIPDNIAAHIPYFIKGDLYRDDEPNEASEARNWYEAAMDAILNSRANKVSKVTSIFSQTET